MLWSKRSFSSKVGWGTGPCLLIVDIDVGFAVWISFPNVTGIHQAEGLLSSI